MNKYLKDEKEIREYILEVLYSSKFNGTTKISNINSKCISETLLFRILHDMEREGILIIDKENFIVLSNHS